MSNRIKVTIPICILLFLCLSIGVFAVVSLAADTPVESVPAAVTMDVAAMDAGGIAAPNTAQETLAPRHNVTEGEENPDEKYGSDYEAIKSPSGESGYELTDDERIAVECAVMCEAGGESVKGQMMVAQSILDGSLRNGFNVYQTISRYDIASISYFYVTEEVKDSVSRVFDDGERVTEQKTDLWYNPALVKSAWHEKQEYVITVGSHRFFWMKKGMDE